MRALVGSRQSYLASEPAATAVKDSPLTIIETVAGAESGHRLMLRTRQGQNQVSPAAQPADQLEGIGAGIVADPVDNLLQGLVIISRVDSSQIVVEGPLSVRAM